MALLEQGFGASFDELVTQAVGAGFVRARSIVSATSGRKSILSIVAGHTLANNTPNTGGYLELIVLRGKQDLTFAAILDPSQGLNVAFRAPCGIPSQTFRFEPGELSCQDGEKLHVVNYRAFDVAANVITTIITSLSVTGLDESNLVNVKLR